MADDPVAAHSVARFNLGQCLVWLEASQRCLITLRGMGQVTTLDDGLRLAGDAQLGVLALDQALIAARWVVANDDAALKALPPPATSESLDRYWVRTRVLRSRVVAHSAEWIGRDATAAVTVDSNGLHASNGLAFGFAEWGTWLDLLEPWARARLAAPIVPSHRAAVSPAWLQFPAVSAPPPPEFPPKGVVWFGEDYDSATFRVDGRIREIGPGRQFAAVGQLVRASKGGIQVRVTDPSGVQVVAGQAATPAPEMNMVGCVIRGTAASGLHVIALTDSAGDVLAEGAINIGEDSS